MILSPQISSREVEATVPDRFFWPKLVVYDDLLFAFGVDIAHFSELGQEQNTDWLPITRASYSIDGREFRRITPPVQLLEQMSYSGYSILTFKNELYFIGRGGVDTGKFTNKVTKYSKKEK